MAANDQTEIKRLRARVVVIPFFFRVEAIARAKPPLGYFDYPEGPTAPDETFPTVVWIAKGQTRITFPRSMSLQEDQVWVLGDGAATLVDIEYSGDILPQWTTLDIFFAQNGAPVDSGYHIQIDRVRTESAQD